MYEDTPQGWQVPLVVAPSLPLSRLTDHTSQRFYISTDLGTCPHPGAERAREPSTSNNYLDTLVLPLTQAIKPVPGNTEHSTTSTTSLLAICGNNCATTTPETPTGSCATFNRNGCKVHKWSSRESRSEHSRRDSCKNAERGKLIVIW